MRQPLWAKRTASLPRGFHLYAECAFQYTLDHSRDVDLHAMRGWHFIRSRQNSTCEQPGNVSNLWLKHCCFETYCSKCIKPLLCPYIDITILFNSLMHDLCLRLASLADGLHLQLHLSVVSRVTMLWKCVWSYLFPQEWLCETNIEAHVLVSFD